MKSKEITVVPYNPEWPRLFAVEAEKIAKAVGDNCIALHHVGSTAVPGLAAKPKIDIILVAKDPAKTIAPLEKIGFVYKGEWNIPGKYGFVKRVGGDVNLHVYAEGHPEIEGNLLFRDYLRNHPTACSEYVALKKRLLKDKTSFEKEPAALLVNYSLRKGDFIRKILKAAGFQRTRFLKCSDATEWEAAKRLSEGRLLNQESPDHVHLILYQGVDIIGYADIHFSTDKRANIDFFKVEASHQEYAELFLDLLKQWLQSIGKEL